MVSIHRSLLPRPDAPESAQALAETIMQRLLNTHSHTLTTRHIAVTTRDALHHFDKTAALRYALDRGLITP
jgi:transcriptional regulator NrdR family protein